MCLDFGVGVDVCLMATINFHDRAGSGIMESRPSSPWQQSRCSALGKWYVSIISAHHYA